MGGADSDENLRKESRITVAAIASELMHCRLLIVDDDAAMPALGEIESGHQSDWPSADEVLETARQLLAGVG